MQIFTNMYLILFSAAVAIFLFFIFLSSVIYRSERKDLRSSKDNPDDWLFGNFSHKVFKTFFPRKNADDAATKIGINIERYYQSCMLTRTEPDVERLVVDYIYAIIILILCLAAAIFAGPAVFIVGFLAFAYLVIYQQRKLDSKAAEMRAQVASELPRFLDVLGPELHVGMPIESAMYTLCEKMDDTLIAREFLDTLNEMKIGKSGWLDALDNLAQRYNIDTLTDLVLKINVAYKQGISISDTVERASKDIKTMHVLSIKENAGKAKVRVYIPIFVFQLIPLMVYMLLPAIGQMMNL